MQGRLRMLQWLRSWSKPLRGARRRRYVRAAAARQRRVPGGPLEDRSLLAQLVTTGTALDVIFTLPATTNNVILEDIGVIGNNISQIRSVNGAFDITPFSNAMRSVTILRGTTADTITVNSLPDPNNYLDLGFPTQPVVALQPFDTVSFAGTANFGVLVAAATNINVGPAATLNVPKDSVIDFRANNLSI